jgi:hypothetical protein
VKQIQTGNAAIAYPPAVTRRAWADHKYIMPSGFFGARVWRRPVSGSILSRITRIPTRFTVPGPSVS